MIQVENLHKSFDGHAVLRGASFQVETGELLALIGRSGDGKSVMLKHISGLMEPDSGRIMIDGRDLGQLSLKRTAVLRSRLGFLFQNGALFDSMSVFDNVAFPLQETRRMRESEIAQNVMNALEAVGLERAAAKYPAQLSGGMAKRAALARCLVCEPQVMLFDEPTTGLDPITETAIMMLIQRCHRRFGFTGIIVTHQVPEIFGIVQKVALLHEGTIRFSGTPSQVAESDDAVVRRFVRGGERAATG